MMETRYGQHSVYSLYFHLVYVVAYRRQVMTPVILGRCIEIITELAPRFGVEIQDANGEPDHLHLLLSGTPSLSLIKFINSTKTVTSRRLKVEYPEIRKQLWKEKFWSRSYFVATTGGATLEAVARYIQNQSR